MIRGRIIIFVILTFFLIILSYLLLEILDKNFGKLFVGIIGFLIVVNVVLLGREFNRITGTRDKK